MPTKSSSIGPGRSCSRSLQNVLGPKLKYNIYHYHELIQYDNYIDVKHQTESAFKRYLTIIACSENQHDTCLYYLDRVKKPLELSPAEC